LYSTTSVPGAPPVLNKPQVVRSLRLSPSLPAIQVTLN
jgi:hypothetical protein